jgi:hypothetical protein
MKAVQSQYRACPQFLCIGMFSAWSLYATRVQRKCCSFSISFDMYISQKDLTEAVDTIDFNLSCFGQPVRSTSRAHQLVSPLRIEVLYFCHPNLNAIGSW